MAVLAALAGAAALTLLAAALRRPVLVRMALRNAVRRKIETALVVLGSLLGTAIITGSLTVGDTLDGSVRAQIPEQLGPVDVVVQAADPAVAAAASDRLDGFASQHVDGMLTLERLDAAVVAGDDLDAADHAEPRATLLELDVAAAADFGGEAEATGLADVAQPAAGEALVTADVAETLDLTKGDAVTAAALGTDVTLRVADVVPRVGVAGFAPGSQRSESMNVIVAPGTLAELAAYGDSTLVAAAGPQQLVLLSGTGDVMDGADATDALVGDVRVDLEGLEGVEVARVKADALDTAETAGDELQELFLAIGAFAVMAGVLLLVNLFVMLAEERKPTLGMMRAVGMTRRDLVRLLVLEGALYAVGAAALGALAGIGVGRAIVAVAASIFADFGAPELRFAVEPATVATGFLIGLLVSAATIAVTSLRVARLDIITAVRDLPPAGRPRRWWRTVALGLGTAAFGIGSVFALATEELVGALALPPLTALCGTALAVRFLPTRVTVSAVAAAVLAYAVLIDRFIVVADADVVVFVVQGVVLVAAAVALLTVNQDLVGRALSRLGGGLVGRLGTAYPLAKRARTAMTLSMFSLVVFTLVFILALTEVFGSLTDEMVADEAGGYDVLATANPANVPPVDDVEAVDGVAAAVALTSGVAEFRPDGADRFRSWPTSGVDRAYVDGGPVRLEERDERYASDDEVWEAVLADPSLVVLDLFFLQDVGGPGEKPAGVGDRIVVRDMATGAETTRTVAAVAAAAATDTGVLASRESVAGMAATATPSRFVLKVAEPAAADAVADTLQAELLANGLQADSYRFLVEQVTRANLQFFQLMQGYLSLGLVIGVAGLGVIMVRAVRERRREVGALRVVGLRPRTVGGAFLLESGFVAVEGVLVGAALALVTSWQVIINAEVFGDMGVDFAVPWPHLAAVLAGTLLASLLAALQPAVRAARIRPAEVLRTVE